jgi:hypothetical protein
MEFPDKWYIRGSNELEQWTKKEIKTYINVVFYTDQLFYDPINNFCLWN